MSTDHPDHDDFGSLHRDTPRLVDRRRALMLLGGASLAGVVAACGSGSGSQPSGTVADSTMTSTAAGSTASTTVDTTAGTTAGTVAEVPGAEIPDETQGPFPADGSNGPNLLTEDGVVRNDLTTSIGPLSGTAEGVPTTIQLSIVDAVSGAALPGAAVYLWHCTADGRYSMYEVDDQNFLRGVQVADDAGRLTFTTVFPGCYRGRWPHCHFEVFTSLGDATAGSEAIKVSQLAFPEADCAAVYADDRYASSADALSQLSLDSDGVFRDGWTDQVATVAGSLDAGYTASLLVRV